MAGEVWIKRRVDQGGSSPVHFYNATLAIRKLHPILDHPAEACSDQLNIVGLWYERLPHFELNFTPSSGQELQTEFKWPSLAIHFTWKLETEAMMKFTLKTNQLSTWMRSQLLGTLPHPWRVTSGLPVNHPEPPKPGIFSARSVRRVRWRFGVNPLKECHVPETTGNLAASQAASPPAISMRLVIPFWCRMLVAIEER
jgi:hypothetical protein